MDEEELKQMRREKNELSFLAKLLDVEVPYIHKVWSDLDGIVPAANYRMVILRRVVPGWTRPVEYVGTFEECKLQLYWEVTRREGPP